MAPIKLLTLSVLLQNLLPVSPQSSFVEAFRPAFQAMPVPLKAQGERVEPPVSILARPRSRNLVTLSPDKSVGIESVTQPASAGHYPVPSADQTPSRHGVHLSSTLLYGKQLIAFASEEARSGTDEKSIIQFLRKNYVQSHDDVHFVLDHARPSLEKLSQQLAGMVDRFEGRAPIAQQIEHANEYAGILHFLKGMPDLGREKKVQLALGLTYKLVVDELEGNCERINLRKLKTWFAFVVPLLAQTDPDLNSLKNRLGDYHQSSQWVSELHLNSFAKHSARRIYRHKGSSTVIAETLSEHGEITETEMIEQLPSGAFNFVSFDASAKFSPFGMIRNHRGQAAIRPTPDVCYGCHYNLKTGAFNVIRPSFADLNLRDFDFADKELLNRRKIFAKPGEQMIVHGIQSE